MDNVQNMRLNFPDGTSPHVAEPDDGGFEMIDHFMTTSPGRPHRNVQQLPTFELPFRGRSDDDTTVLSNLSQDHKVNPELVNANGSNDYSKWSASRDTPTAPPQCTTADYSITLFSAHDAPPAETSATPSQPSCPKATSNIPNIASPGVRKLSLQRNENERMHGTDAPESDSSSHAPKGNGATTPNVTMADGTVIMANGDIHIRSFVVKPCGIVMLNHPAAGLIEAGNLNTMMPPCIRIANLNGQDIIVTKGGLPRFDSNSFSGFNMITSEGVQIIQEAQDSYRYVKTGVCLSIQRSSRDDINNSSHPWYRPAPAFSMNRFHHIEDITVNQLDTRIDKLDASLDAVEASMELIEDTYEELKESLQIQSQLDRQDDPNSDAQIRTARLLADAKATHKAARAAKLEQRKMIRAQRDSVQTQRQAARRQRRVASHQGSYAGSSYPAHLAAIVRQRAAAGSQRAAATEVQDTVATGSHPAGLATLARPREAVQDERTLQQFPTETADAQSRAASTHHGAGAFQRMQATPPAMGAYLEDIASAVQRSSASARTQDTQKAMMQSAMLHPAQHGDDTMMQLPMIGTARQERIAMQSPFTDLGNPPLYINNWTTTLYDNYLGARAYDGDCKAPTYNNDQKGSTDESSS